MCSEQGAFGLDGYRFVGGVVENGQTLECNPTPALPFSEGEGVESERRVLLRDYRRLFGNDPIADPSTIQSLAF